MDALYCLAYALAQSSQQLLLDFSELKFAAQLEVDAQVCEVKNDILDHNRQAAQLATDCGAIGDKESILLVVWRHDERNSWLPHLHFGSALDPFVLDCRARHAAFQEDTICKNLPLQSNRPVGNKCCYLMIFS